MDENIDEKEYCNHTSGIISVQIIDGDYWCVHCKRKLKL